MNVRIRAALRVAVLLMTGALVAGCATPEESRDMGDNNDGSFYGDQPEEGSGTSGTNTQGDAIIGPTLPATDPSPSSLSTAG